MNQPESQPQIRQLRTQDANTYRRLRLKALDSDPHAFLSTFDHERLKDIASFSYEISASTFPPIWGYYGLFLEGKLVGYCQIVKNWLPKKAHTAELNNLYVDPDYRQRGYGKKLVEFLLEKLADAGIEIVTGSYLAKNTNVAKFYQELGFEEYGRRQQTVKWQGEYDDEVEIIKKL